MNVMYELIDDYGGIKDNLEIKEELDDDLDAYFGR